MKKAIVIYYSYGGNTRSVAEKIRKIMNADQAEIETIKPYTGCYDDVVNQGQREVESGFLPEIRMPDTDLSQYDAVILGTPVWWYTFAPAMNSFLHRVDLSGKTIFPFATNGGWLGHTFQDLQKVCKGVDVRAGLDIRFSEDKQITPDTEIRKWVRQIIE